MAAGSKIGIKIAGLMIGIPVSIATRKLVEQVWGAARPQDPPRRPSDRGVRWADAIAWGALSAAGVVVTDLLSRRGAEITYRAFTGNQPPPATPSKAEKKAQKSREKARIVEN